MITPEPTATIDWDTPPWVIEVPAAGHLGVIEEECPALHGEDSLTENGIPFPCVLCGAAV